MQKKAYTVFSSNTLQMLCFFDRLVKLFAFLHWELATVSSTIQHSTPAVFIGHSLPPPVFICPHCTVFPPIFLSTPTTEQIFFLVFLPFISLALSFFHHNFILQIPIELCRSQSRNTSRQLEGLFYCIPSLFLCFCESFLLCRHFCCCCCTSWSQNRSRRFGAGGGGSRALAPSLHRHIHIYTNTTQTLHYTKTDSQTRSASSICLDGGSGFLVVVVLVKEKRKGEKGNTANRTTKSTTTTTGTWCTAFCLRYSFCLLSFFFFFSFSIYLPTATTAAKAEAPLSGAHSFYVFPFFSLSFTK